MNQIQKSTFFLHQYRNLVPYLQELCKPIYEYHQHLLMQELIKVAVLHQPK